MVAKRVMTFLLGLVFFSLIAKILVLYTNPSSRLYGVQYVYEYSRLNYLQFFILFIIPAISAVFLYRADFKIINNFFDRIAGLVKKAFYAVIENPEKVLIVTLVLFWIFNLMEGAFFRNLIETKSSFGGPFDPYHEGEKIGFLYSYLNNDVPLSGLFIEHGYFLEVLSPYIAYLIAPENHAVMGYRILHTLERLLSWLGSIWVIWEIVHFTTEKENKFFFTVKFILFSIVFVATNASFLALDYQQGFMVLQLGFVLHFLRKLTCAESSQFYFFTTSFIIGLSIPLGLLYSVKYGLLFSAVFVLTAFLFIFHERKKFFLLGSSLGVISSGAILYLILGWWQLLALGKMFLYWVKFYPPSFSKPFVSDASEHYLWIIQVVIGILILCGTQLSINFRSSKNFKDFIHRNIHVIFLLALSLMTSKIAMDNSDKLHFRTIAPWSLFLLFVLIGGWLDKLKEFRRIIVQSYTTHKKTWVLVLVFFLFINTHPRDAFRHIKPYWKYISTTDDELLAKQGKPKQYNYLEAVEKMRPEIQDMECFYTLTSEGIWYYYFKKPSCSRHHLTFHTIGESAPYEVVDALREKQPEIILFSNYNGNKSFYTTNTQPEIYQFIYQNYRPYKLIGSHWFWKWFPGGITETQVSTLDITRSIETPIFDNYRGFIDLNGVLTLKNIYAIDGVYITPANQETILAVSVSDTLSSIKAGFLEVPLSIEVPMANISTEINSFQLWGYSSSLHERIKIGKEFVIDHSKIDMF